MWRCFSCSIAYCGTVNYQQTVFIIYINLQAVRVATRYARPSPPPVGAVAPRAAEPTAAPADGNVAAVSRAQYVSTLTAATACA